MKTVISNPDWFPDEGETRHLAVSTVFSPWFQHWSNSDSEAFNDLRPPPAVGSSAWLHIISMLGPTAGLAFPQWGCFLQLCVYPSTLAHPSACTGSLFSLPGLLRGLRSTESHNPSGFSLSLYVSVCVCVCAHILDSFMLFALTEELPLKNLNWANLLVQTDWRGLFSEVSVLTCAPGCTDTPLLCISNHLKTKYPLFDPSCIRNPIILVSLFGSRVPQLTLMLTFVNNMAEISSMPILYMSFLESHTASVLPQPRWLMRRSPASLQMRPLLRGKDSRLAPCLTPKVGSGGQQKHLTSHPNFRTAVAFAGWNISHDIREQRGANWMRQPILRRRADFIPRNDRFYRKITASQK